MWGAYLIRTQWTCGCVFVMRESALRPLREPCTARKPLSIRRAAVSKALQLFGLLLRADVEFGVILWAGRVACGGDRRPVFRRQWRRRSRAKEAHSVVFERSFTCASVENGFLGFERKIRRRSLRQWIHCLRRVNDFFWRKLTKTFRRSFRGSERPQVNERYKYR